MRFAGKTALVTGASRGIGAATARQLAREGADVVVHYAQAAEKAEAVCEEIRALGRQAWAVQVDVADREAVNPMVRDVLERVGQLDLLVNNAAEVGACSFDELTPEHWDRMIQVNLTGVYNMLWAFKDHFCARGSGSIVNVSSVAATAVRPNIMPYAAAKAGVISLTRISHQPL